MDRRLRIALLAGEHPGLGHAGGVGTYTATLADALRGAGSTVITLVADEAGAIHEIDPQGIRMIGRWSGPVALRPIASAGLLRDCLRRFAPDVVEAPNWGGLGAWVHLPGCASVVRLSTPVRAIRPRDGMRRIARNVHHAWEQRSVARADLLIADSAAVGRLAADCYGRRPHAVIPHPFPSADGPPLPPPIGRGILAVGRLEHRKGTDILLAAWHRIRRRHPDWHLHLVGADRGGFGARCLAALGSDGVTSHGQVSASELSAIARTCPLAVMPSRWESFGMAILEAWSRGQAVVASDAGGLPGVVGDAGAIVPSGDAPALAHAIAGLLDDEAQRHRYAEQGRLRLTTLFCPAACAAASLDAYRCAVRRVQRDRTGS